jgi:hypothetical protein
MHVVWYTVQLHLLYVCVCKAQPAYNKLILIGSLCGRIVLKREAIMIWKSSTGWLEPLAKILLQSVNSCNPPITKPNSKIIAKSFYIQTKGYWYRWPKIFTWLWRLNHPCWSLYKSSNFLLYTPGISPFLTPCLAQLITYCTVTYRNLFSVCWLIFTLMSLRVGGWHRGASRRI